MPPSSVVSHWSVARSRSQTGSSLRRQRCRCSAERGRDLARVDRLERGLGAVRERERGRVPCDDPETSEDLRGGEVLRQEPAEARLVVVRHERPHQLDDLVDRPVADRGHASPRQVLGSERADDVEAVGEVVEPQRVDVQPARVLVERVHRRVAVARAGERGQAHHPDDELVPAQPGRRVRQLRRLGPEGRARHVVEEVGVGDLHRLGELAQLALERGRRPRVVAAGAACEKKGEHDDPAHPLRVNAATSDMSSLTCRD